MHTLLPIPSVDSETLAWQRPILGQRRILTTQVGAADITVEFRNDVHIQAANFVVIKAADSTVWIGVEDLDNLPLEQSLDVTQISTLPKQILLGVLETLLEDLLRSFSDELGTACEITDFIPASKVSGEFEEIGFKLSWATDSATRGIIRGDSSALRLIAELIDRQPTSNSIAVESLPIPVSLEIGQTTVPLADLQQLQLHDVLMMKEPFVDSSDQAIARFPSPLPSSRVRLGNQKICFEESTTPLRPDTIQQSTAAPSVTVTFRRAIYFIRLEQINQLATKTPIPATIGNSVTLLIDDTPFATGELISFSGQHGVRLLSIAYVLPQHGDAHDV